MKCGVKSTKRSSILFPFCYLIARYLDRSRIGQGSIDSVDKCHVYRSQDATLNLPVPIQT